MTVDGRGDRVQEGSVPVAKARCVANARLSGVIVHIGLFLLTCVGRGLLRRPLPLPRFVMGIACLRFGNLGGRAPFGFGR